MGAEAWIGAAIVGYCMLIFVILGIVMLRSNKPVGFWTGEKPPAAGDVTDIRAYNRGHGRMFICYGIAMMLAWILGIFLQNEIGVLLLFFGVMAGGLAVLIGYHQYLYRKYVRKRTESGNGKE